jgi:GH15 family glucan-1,4-alpha-glucosidase
MWAVTLGIEDYAIIGDTHTAALVGRDGSIDWLCLPRFDSSSCFAKLLGSEENGHWRICPSSSTEKVRETRRAYRQDSLVLETTFETENGTVVLTDCMPVREEYPQVVRMIQCTRGTVDMRMDLTMRFDYGSVVPWVRRAGRLLAAIAGPDALSMWGSVDFRGEDLATVADFTMSQGETEYFQLTWYPSHQEAPRPANVPYCVEDTEMWWQEWAAGCTFHGQWRDSVVRSLITLKALTYAPTGGIVAAATTSLPETLGGVRNWDYRYCWLRDATLTLEALMRGGFHDEAMDWRNWLLRAAAGDPADLQIMYGPAGERRLDEWEASWLSGYEGSVPVRIGNAAADQFQLDVYGEVMNALYEASLLGEGTEDISWGLQEALMSFLETGWREPDDGIWEVRGPRRHFTHSKVMAWVAMDRAVRMVDECKQDGPADKWREICHEIRDEVLTKGYNEDVGAFTQYYGSTQLDACLLMIPLVGFLPATDPRMRSTIEAIERDLTEDGFVLRYKADEAHEVDGLEGREGAFLACSFWLADCLEMLGRHDDALALFERLLALQNDVGLLSEEYDAKAKRQVGNFPQAFSHVSLVNSAMNLSGYTSVKELGVERRAVLSKLLRQSVRKRQWREVITPGSRRNTKHARTEGSSSPKSPKPPKVAKLARHRRAGRRHQ